MNEILQGVLYVLVLIAAAVPLGIYMEKVMNGKPVFLGRVLAPVERAVYMVLRVDPEKEMDGKTYFLCVLWFSLAGGMLLFFLLIGQGWLPLNPEGWAGISWATALNIAVSFVTNTNWQAYSGENRLSYLVQMLGLTVQNFVSAGVGLAVLFALFRGFVRTEARTIGNFWVDFTRSILYVLLPLSLFLSVALAAQGTIQNFSPYIQAELLEPVPLADGTILHQAMIPGGPAASQTAIQQLGTNGGGFFGANAAHPFANPTPLSNALELWAILLIPAALCFSFGRAVYDMRQGKMIFAVMLTALLLGWAGIFISESQGTAELSQQGQVALRTSQEQPGGNMEGKETRFGQMSSAAWAEFTTAASNGSVNSMHDSYTPLGGMVLLLNMELGEVIFGGIGCGLYGMLAFVILTVFIAGLLVGRTPEYLGKKIEPYEMKMAVCICLATPVAILVGSGLAALWPGTLASLGNQGAHGFSELLYAYSSCGGNNGSAFAGFMADTPYFNLSLSAVMLFARFVPMGAVLAIAGHMAGKKRLAATEGTLRTDTLCFAGLLLMVIFLLGALSFFPALSLGPVAEFFQSMS